MKREGVEERHYYSIIEQVLQPLLEFWLSTVVLLCCIVVYRLILSSSCVSTEEEFVSRSERFMETGLYGWSLQKQYEVPYPRWCHYFHFEKNQHVAESLATWNLAGVLALPPPLSNVLSRRFLSTECERRHPRDIQ